MRQPLALLAAEWLVQRASPKRTDERLCGFVCFGQPAMRLVSAKAADRTVAAAAAASASGETYESRRVGCPGAQIAREQVEV